MTTIQTIRILTAATFWVILTAIWLFSDPMETWLRLVVYFSLWLFACIPPTLDGWKSY